MRNDYTEGILDRDMTNCAQASTNVTVARRRTRYTRGLDPVRAAISHSRQSTLYVGAGMCIV